MNSTYKNYGLCLCGCGGRTVIAKRSDTQKGWVKGEPLKYISGHANQSIGKNNTQKAIGKKSLSSHGYVRVLVGKGVRKYEHILVAEKALGRALKSYGKGNPKTEVVHHINGDRKDNRPENLLICTHSYHTELHHRLEQSPDWPQFRKAVGHGK